MYIEGVPFLTTYLLLNLCARKCLRNNCQCQCICVSIILQKTHTRATNISKHVPKVYNCLTKRKVKATFSYDEPLGLKANSCKFRTKTHTTNKFLQNPLLNCLNNLTFAPSFHAVLT